MRKDHEVALGRSNDDRHCDQASAADGGQSGADDGGSANVCAMMLCVDDGVVKPGRRVGRAETRGEDVIMCAVSGRWDRTESEGHGM